MGTPVGISPMRASGFLSTLGVVTHVPYTDGGYVNLGNVVADLHYLGITQVRDSLSDGSNGSAPLSSDIYLAQQGIKFTTIVEVSTTAGLNYALSLIDQVNAAVPGSITAVEGPNEINNFPLTFNGVSGLQGAIDLQKALYADVHSDPHLAGVPVDYFTGYDAGSIGAGPNPYTTAGLADYDTQHPYPTYGQAPAWFVNPSNSLPNEGPVYGPAVYTETGYSTNGGSSGGLVTVNQDVQAKYTLDLLMDAAKDGISKTYLYQLMDAYQPGSPQGDDGFGLFDPNNAPKEAATAIHNLTTILADNGAGSNTFATTPLNYSVAGLPSTGNNMLMEKSNGAYDIVVWNEPQIWNESTGTEITAPTVNVNVELGKTYIEVEVFDPLVGSTPVQTLTQVSSVQLSITDHPLIVEIEPAPKTATVIQTDTNSFGSTSLTEVASQYFYLDGSGGSGPALQYAGANVTAGEFGGWTPIGAAQTTSGYEVAWKVAGANEYTVWTTDSHGNYSGNLIGAVSGNSYALESLETTFNQDLNGDGVIGPTTTVIQTDTTSFGSTSLTEVASQYFYLDGSGGSGPALQYAGANVTAGEFGGWTPIGAAQTTSGYEVAWKVAGANEYTVWTTDSHGNYSGNLIGAVSGNSYALESLETTFNQDLNGDGVIGPTTTVIQTDTTSFGSTSLTEVASQYFYLDGSGGSGPALQYAGANVTAGEFGGWTPIGAAQTTSGYEVAWKVAGANEYTVWTTDSHGNYSGNLIGAVSGNSYALESLETTFNQDLNGDGVIGPTTTVIQTDTTSFGSTSLTEVASQYFYLDGSGGSGPALQYAGANVTAGEFGGWTPIGAAQTTSGYEVAWKVAGANEYTVWTTDSHGNYSGNLIGAVSGNSYALESLETTFNQDLNGDGVIGLYATPATTEQISQPLAGASGVATIGASATLELTAADSASVTFAAPTGMLKLDQASTFTGEIFNFTGNGSLSGSDQIDLRTINYNSVHDSYGTGVLTVTDGTNIANLHFSGSYTLANFKFASDGSGGTIVYDPPVLNSPTAGTRIVTADHSNDAFLFHANLSQTASTEHTFGSDIVHVGQAEFASASLAIIHDAHENIIFDDALHDTHNNALAQQHHSGFLI